jgi:hypothetical protein
MEQQQDQVFNSTWCIVVGAIQSTHNNGIAKHKVENLALKDSSLSLAFGYNNLSNTSLF